METNLLIDIGNTNCKVVFYYNGTMGRLRRSSERDAVGFIKSVVESGEFEVDTMIVSNVRTANAPVEAALKPLCRRLIMLDYKTELPVNLDYGFDATELGTIDFIDKKGRYLGGNISLGMRSRFRALNEFTGLLPFISPDAEFPPVGVTTTGAMSAGVVFGLMFEVEGYIKRYPQHTVIFTGGDAFYFAHKMKNTVFATQDLVLQGLSFIADYYMKKDEN